MYRPPPNRVDDLGAALAMVRDHGFGHLVVAGADGLDAVPLPVLVDVPPATSHGPADGRSDEAAVRIRGHVAKANPIWRAAPCPALLIVSPVDAYVSPASYPSKAVDPRVVPTWNYEVVHVHGTLHARPEPSWVEGVVRELTARHEAPRADPWSVDDAPAEHVERLLRAIVGVELAVTRVEGKRKLSQNRDPGDIAGVVRDLAGGDDRARAVAAAMADVVATSDRRPHRP